MLVLRVIVLLIALSEVGAAVEGEQRRLY